MKTLKIGLLPKILIAMFIGTLVGLGLEAVKLEFIARIFVTVNGIFSQFLGFAIPLIIVGLVTTAIADIGNRAGKMLLTTVIIAYGSTIIAGLVSYLTGATLFQTVTEVSDLSPFFTVSIPPLMGVMTALVLAFTIGLGLASTQNETLLKVGKRDKYKLYGDLVTANIYRITQGMTGIEAENYYSENCEKVFIPLETDLTPSQNAQKYYKEYKKRQTAVKMLTDLIHQGEIELEVTSISYDI